MKKQFAILFVVLGLCGACGDDDSELKKSIYIKDQQYPGLPEYSEFGFNTFGAYYDRQAFVSSDRVPIKVVATNGETTFSFNGETSNTNEMSIIFKMPDYSPEKYSDLLTLNGITLDLSDEKYKVIVKNYGIESEAQVLNGEFKFKRIQNLLVDTKQVEVILSGTFKLQALIDGEPVTISDGRFDVGVGNDNFYRF